MNIRFPILLGTCLATALVAVAPAAAQPVRPGPRPLPILTMVLPLDAPAKAVTPAPKVREAAYRGITRTDQLPAHLQQVRKRLIAKQSVRYKDLQALADAGDGLAAYALAQRIEAMEKPELLESAAHYYAMAAHSGRDSAVRPLIRLLTAAGTGFRPAAIKEARQVLEGQAEADNAFAVDALARFYAEGTVLPKDPERARELTARAAERGDVKAALKLAMELLAGQPDAVQKEEAVRFLQIVAQSEDVGQRAMAENLMRSLAAPTITTATQTEVTP